MGFSNDIVRVVVLQTGNFLCPKRTDSNNNNNNNDICLPFYDPLTLWKFWFLFH